MIARTSTGPPREAVPAPPRPLAEDGAALELQLHVDPPPVHDNLAETRPAGADDVDRAKQEIRPDGGPGGTPGGRLGEAGSDVAEPLQADRRHDVGDEREIGTHASILRRSGRRIGRR